MNKYFENEEFWHNYLLHQDYGFKLIPDYPRDNEATYVIKSCKGKLESEKMKCFCEYAKDIGISKECIAIAIIGIVLRKYSNEDIFFLGRVSVTEMNEKVIDRSAISLPLEINFEGINDVYSLFNRIQDNLNLIDKKLLYCKKEVQLLLQENLKNGLVCSIIMSVCQDKNYIANSQNIKAVDMYFKICILDEMDIRIDYNSNLFRKSSVEKIMQAFFLILNDIVVHKKRQLSSLCITSKEDANLIIHEWNDTFKMQIPRKSLGDLLEETANEYGDKIAIKNSDDYITYKELSRRVNKYANFLLVNGVHKGEIVGVVVDKSIDTIIAILGIIRAGAAYLPVSNRYPQSRILYMLKESSVKIVIQPEWSRELDLSNYNVINTNNRSYELYSDIVPSSLANENSLAYIIYTSGSTGDPKGVMIYHYSVIRLVKNTEYVELDACMNFLQTSSLTFDVSVFEVWGCLLNGLTMYILNDDQLLDTKLFRKQIEEEQINIIYLTTPVFHNLVNERSDLFVGVNYLIIAGDVLSKKHVEIVRESNNEIRIINAYGPTENATFSTAYLIDNTYKEFVPIGKPISHSTAYVLDCDMQLLPVGAVGELYLGGKGVARGYLNKKELTEKYFVNDPFFGGKMYKSGDLARWLPDGNLEYLGRIDNQVKIRGFRVELDEIKNIILRDENIKECFITPNTSKDIIIAYIVTSESKVGYDWKKVFSDKLPDYMMPSFFVEVKELPLNINGKVDKKRLPDFKIMKDSYISDKKTGYDQKEQMLIAIWKEILSIENISPDDSFERLGGTSLDAIRILNRIRKCGYQITAKDLMKYNTIHDIAKCMNIDGEE
uniref:non-ribosomal peptide synthetase n=1 Tax=Enterocloster clostridioformis TaxID=1531 RepID=UPI0025A4E32A|nr:non-ribosomal peptide synthetase [Enterocloster clostridioformis]